VADCQDDIFIVLVPKHSPRADTDVFSAAKQHINDNHTRHPSTMVRFVVAAAALLASLSTVMAWTSVIVGKSVLLKHNNHYKSPFSRQPHDTRPSSSSLVTLLATQPSSYGDILLYNSQSRQKQSFQTLEPLKVKMYTCGPTVYDSAHVGNFRAFLTYDVLKRVLAYFSYDVLHICNLTDVDDKIIARCLRDDVDLQTLTRKYEDAFLQDLTSLNILPATHYPRATQHIPDMVDMILTLYKNGLAYPTSDQSWYFDTAKDPNYGTRLVELSTKHMEQTTTIKDNVSNEKRNWQDFCLWKATKQGEEGAVWETSIGNGRPGWHLECSAMARKYLGDTIDIHCGGIDLKFPHHENEIAQSQGTTGQTFCNCWIHNGFVNIGDEKMSKSMGNFLTLQQACPTRDSIRAYRYLVVSSHYRTALSFTEQAMNAAKNALQRIDKVRAKIQQVIVLLEAESNNLDERNSEIAQTVVPEQMDNFETALKDDLSMPRAAACLFALVKAAEGEFKRVDKEGGSDLDLVGLQAIYNAMDQMDRVFGIFYKVPNSNDEVETKVPQEVMELVDQRTAAKDAKDWQLADSLRARITELGFAVKDVKGGEPIVSPIEQ